MEIENLNENQIKKLVDMPIIETRILTSKDGKYVIHRTIITDIKPATYYKKVLDDY